VVNALFRIIPSLKNLLAVVGLIVIIGAVIAVQAYKGEFYHCSITNSSIITKEVD
jgi:Ion transport protein.